MHEGTDELDDDIFKSSQDEKELPKKKEARIIEESDEPEKEVERAAEISEDDIF